MSRTEQAGMEVGVVGDVELHELPPPYTTKYSENAEGTFNRVHGLQSSGPNGHSIVGNVESSPIYDTGSQSTGQVESHDAPDRLMEGVNSPGSISNDTSEPAPGPFATSEASIASTDTASPAVLPPFADNPVTAENTEVDSTQLPTTRQTSHPGDGTSS